MNQYFYESYEITELSYFEYKNLVKNLFTDDPWVLNQVFNNTINNSVKGNKEIDIFDKVKILLFLRSLTLGEDFDITFKEKNYKMNINSIVNNISINSNEIVSDRVTFKKSNSFYVENLLNEVIISIEKIVLDNGEINFSKLTNEQKNIIFNEISDSNISHIVNSIADNLKQDNLNLFDMNFNLHNGDILYFLKNIFKTDLNSLYDLEYTLIKNLNLNTVDFQNYSLSEMKILLNKLKDEYKDNKQSGVPVK
tara:strand:+ start:23241 stop:23996 length:756 start_codon:yes stop_codon:yes gene_type:complete